MSTTDLVLLKKLIFVGSVLYSTLPAVLSAM